MKVTKRLDTGYEEERDLQITGGFKYEIFKKTLSNYNIVITPYDSGKVRVTIPRFAELSFGKMTIDSNNINVTDLGLVFSKDCVVEGLRPVNTPSLVTNLKSLSINKKASSLADIISACELSVTCNNTVNVFGGIELGAGTVIACFVDSDPVTKLPKRFGFSFGGINNTEGKILFPSDDNKKIEVPLTLKIDSAGNFDASSEVAFTSPIIFKGISLSTSATSKIKIRLVSDSSIRKFMFDFTNVGTTINIPNDGNCVFNINKFDFSDKNGGTIENIEGGIKTDLRFFSENMIVTSGATPILLGYNTTTKWNISANNVNVNFPKVGDNGFSLTTSFDISSVEGIKNFSCSYPGTIKVMSGFLNVNGFTADIVKEGSVYSLKMSTKIVECDLKSLLNLEKEAKATGENIIMTIGNLSDPINTLGFGAGSIVYDGTLEFDLGIKFKSGGASIDLSSKSVSLSDTKFLIPQIPGLKYFKDADFKIPEDSNKTEFSITKMTVGYNSGKWAFAIDGFEMPGGCEYNLFDLNVVKIGMSGLEFDQVNDKFVISIEKARATTASGYKAEVTKVKITSSNVSIGGGSVTIPELSLGGIGINNLTATFGTDTIGGKDYPYFGGSCAITLPSLNSMEGSLKIQLKDDNFFGVIKEASFELTLGIAAPLGNTGIGLKMVRGSLTKGDFPKNFPEEFKFMFGKVSELKVVSMGLQLVDMSTNGLAVKGGADVWVELTNWGYAMDLNACIYEGYIQAQAGVAYANEIFAARAKVRVACLEGKVIFYVYNYDGSTAISGEGSVAVRLDKGKILNKRIWRWRIRIPKHDIWFDGLGAKFGRFTNGKVGFQARVSFPVLGSMKAFVGDGGLKFFTNYDIYIPQPTTTSQASGNLLKSYAAAPMVHVVKTAIYDPNTVTGASIASAGAINLAATSIATTTQNEPQSQTIMENGVYKGIRMTFDNKLDLERIVLSASTDKIIPNVSIKFNGADVPLDGPNISTDISEVNEETLVDGEVKETGKQGVSYLLGIEKPANGTLVGNWVLEVRCDENVDVSLLTKLSEPTLKINSSVYNSSNSTLTVSGNITSYTGNENVTLLLKNVPKVDTDSVVPSETVVAVSKALSDMDGVKLISLSGGSFTVVIDTSTLRTGTYSLVSELERKVTGTYEEGELSVAPGEETLEYNVSDREEYAENNAIKKYDIVNSNLVLVKGLKVSVTAHGSDPNYRYNLDVRFKNTRVADGYMLFADCYVDGAPVGTRKINLGNTSKARIGQFTEYLTVTNGKEEYKPIKMMVYIVPYKYIDPSKGFVYDFGNNLGYGNVTNNIITLSVPESEKKEVWIQRSTSSVVTGCTSDFGTAATIPVEGSAKGKLTVNANGTGKVLVMVKNVTKRTVELGTGKEDPKKKMPSSILGGAVSVMIGNEKSEFGDVFELVSGANNIDLTLIANVSASEAKAINDTNASISVTLSVYNAENPNNYKEIIIPCKLKLNPLTLTGVNQEKFSSVTGGVIDIYGTELVKGTKVKLGSTELEIIPEESGKARISAKIPQGLTVGDYNLVVEGPIITAGTTNTQTWGNKISIVNSIYEFTTLRDKGNIKKGTSGKFYFGVQSSTGYMGTAGLRVKSTPSGWTVKLNKTLVSMGEEIEATITVPSSEVASTTPKTVIIEACRMSDSVTSSVYSKLGDLFVTVTASDVTAAISSVSNKWPNAGETIKIYGEGFTSSSVPELVTTKGTKTLSVVERTGNYIKATVPTDALSGKLRINTNGVYSPELDLVVVPGGVTANFEKAPLSIILAPGETGYVSVANNGKPVTMTSDYNITASWNTSEGKVQVTIPSDTRPGEYMACANIKYPNTTVQQRLVVYVVNNGKSMEDLTRQFILNGRNLNIKVRGATVTALQIAKLEVDGTAISKTPVKGTDGWDIDVGAVNNGSIVKYQFKYTVSGATFTTPVYEYKVQLTDPSNYDDLYKAVIVETVDGKFKLEVTPKAGFSPTYINANILQGTTIIKSGGMTKDGSKWVFDIDNLPSVKGFDYTLTFKPASTLKEITTAIKTFTNVTSSPPTGSSMTYNFTRGTDGNVVITVTKVRLGSSDVTPSWIRAEWDNGTGTTQKLNLTYDGSKFTGSLGNMNNKTKANLSFTYFANDNKYGDLFKDVTYYDIPKSVNGFVGQFYDNKYFSELKLKTVVPQINYDFTNKPPMGGMLQNSTYSMRWSGKLQARCGEEHTFYLTVPNGKATLWVDGKQIADGNGALSGKCTLVAGKPTDIFVEYATDGSGAIKLEWQSASQSREVVPQERVIAIEVQKPGSSDFAPFTTQVAYDQIGIGWNAPSVTGVAYYELYEGSSLINTTWGGKSFTRSGLLPDKEYTYYVKAFNSSKTLLATSASLVVKTERTPIDLALKKPITASSTATNLQAASCANDDNSSTRWSSNTASNTQWIRVDLGREYEIVKVRLNWREDFYAKYYKVQVSNDDATWRDVYTTISGDGGVDEIRLSSVKARYVRMNATLKGVSNTAYSLYDFNVYGYRSSSSIKTQFYNQITTVQNNNVAPTFKIINTGTENVDLNTLKLRYYYTIDKEIIQVFTCDWTSISPNVTGTFVKMASPKDKADYYLEIGFDTSTPILKPGEFVEVKARFKSDNYQHNYTQTNDYSFNGVSNNYADFDKITVYQSGNLIQGIEPSSSIGNMSFDSDDSGWYLYADPNTAVATGSRDTVNYDTAPAGYTVKCTTKGTGETSIQLLKRGIALEKGKYYNLTFRAKSTTAFTIPKLALMKNVNPYTMYAYAKNVAMTTNWKTYSYTFKINTTDANCRIDFLLGNAIPNGAALYMDNISFSEVSTPVELMSNTSLNADVSNWGVWSEIAKSVVATGGRDTVTYDTQPAGYKVTCTKKGTGSSQIQLALGGIKIEDGKTYNFTFRAKASTAFNISYLKIIKNTSPYTAYSNTVGNIAVTTSWKNFHYVFTATGSDPVARLNFEMGNSMPDGSQLYIDTVSLKEAVVNEVTEAMTNPSFDTDTSDWQINYDTTKGASGTIARDTVNYNTAPAGLKVHCITKGTDTGSMHVSSMGVKVEAGKTYSISFKVKSSVAFNLNSVVLMRRTSPNNAYTAVNPIKSNIAVTTDWQTVTANFTANVTDPDSRLLFYLGNSIPANGDLFLDSFSIKEVL